MKPNQSKAKQIKDKNIKQRKAKQKLNKDNPKTHYKQAKEENTKERKENQTYNIKQKHNTILQNTQKNTKIYKKNSKEKETKKYNEKKNLTLYNKQFLFLFFLQSTILQTLLAFVGRTQNKVKVYLRKIYISWNGSIFFFCHSFQKVKSIYYID